MPLVVLPDAEIVAVEWARAQPDLAGHYFGRVSTRLPAPDRLTFPWLRAFRVATAGNDSSDAPLDVPLVQFDSFAAGTPDGDRDYASASRGARILAAALEALNQPGGSIRVSTPDGDAILTGARVGAGPDRVDEPVTGWARYRLDALLTIKPG